MQISRFCLMRGVRVARHRGWLHRNQDVMAALKIQSHMAADARSNAFQLTFYQLCHSTLDPWPASSTVKDFAPRLVPADSSRKSSRCSDCCLAASTERACPTDQLCQQRQSLGLTACLQCFASDGDMPGAFARCSASSWPRAWHGLGPRNVMRAGCGMGGRVPKA